jgi:integrating conjugative element protein (TIGR03759 family)
MLRKFDMVLFPYASRLNLPGAEAQVTGSRHVALFVKKGCAPCDALALEFQAVGAPFAVYMGGSHQDDERVLSWATHVGIDPGKVHAARSPWTMMEAAGYLLIYP